MGASDYSINAVTRKKVTTGSAGLGPYTFSFEILANTDIAVYLDTTLLVLTSDYTVTINANGTGSVTLVTGSQISTTPTASNTVTIVGARDIERTTDYSVGGDFGADSVNEALDANIIYHQQVDEVLDRSIKAPVTDSTSIDMALPVAASRANKYLAFDSNGNPVANEISEIGTVVAEDDNPQALGTAAPGSSAEYARGDHVHAAPTAASNGGAAYSSNAISVDPNNATDTAIAASDEILFGDVSDSNNVKKDTVQGILDLVSADASSTDMRLAFLLIAENGGDRKNMVDGIADPFMDETDVDTATSTNETYDATGDYYHSRDEVDKFTGGTASVSTGSAANVFDGDTGTEWNSTSAAPEWAKYDLGAGNEVALTRLRVFNGDNTTYDRVNGFTFAGSNDDSSWTTLHTDNIADTGANPTWEDFDFTNVVAYRYYRFTIDSTHGGTTAGVAELEGLALNPQDLTLVSDAFTADSAPDTGRIHVQVMENEAITVNTDLTAEISRDGGTTWTTATLVLQETLADGTKAYEDDDLDISGQPSDTSMKYRIKTLNNKDIEIHGVVLQWA